MKRIIITESQLKKVKKALAKEPIIEIGQSNFSEINPINNVEQSKTLRPAIAKLKGLDHIVIIDKTGYIVGYGPPIKGRSKSEICSVAQNLIDDWEEEVNMNEIDQPDFNNVQPITFCNIK